jgi:hypothetical protein
VLENGSWSQNLGLGLVSVKIMISIELAMEGSHFDPNKECRPFLANADDEEPS